ncbi:MAG: sigma-70 family RNA polymerase sigma factor [Acidimicrobiia bacterium]|jgi:RNA polymerase sigma-70 factor (ECF subfamily)
MGSRDADLAARARQGDGNAYAALVEPHREVAFRVAYLVTGTAADAEDATQEALMKAYRMIHRFNPERPFRPWLLRIVGNEARNRRRSEGRRAVYENRAAGRREVGLDQPETVAARLDTGERLIEAVNRLPERERLVIGLRYFLDLSERETAQAIGIPRGTVKSRLARGLDRLRAEIGDLHE